MPHTAQAECGVQGSFSFRFALVYASLEDVLPRIAQLWEVAQDDSRDGREKAHKRIAEMIAVRDLLHCTILNGFSRIGFANTWGKTQLQFAGTQGTMRDACQGRMGCTALSC